MAIRKALVNIDADHVELPAGDTIEVGLPTFTAAGQISTGVKRWVGSVVPTQAMGQSINISSAGFTSVLSVQVMAMRNTTDVTQCVNVMLKTVTLTAITVNLTQNTNGSLTLVVIQANNLSGITLYVEVIGT